MLSLKRDVRLALLQPVMVFAVIVVDDAYAARGLECVVTSGSEGRHMPKSLHYSGNALDFRILNVPPGMRDSLFSDIRSRLGVQFDVVVEKDHLHVEFDPD